MSVDRRYLLRMAAPAVALPMAASVPALAKEVRLVTRDEIMAAFRFYDMMELRASDLNRRYQILIDMLFETNPENLRAQLQELVDARKDHMVLVDVSSGISAPYDPDMYDHATGEMLELGQRNVDQQLVAAQEQLRRNTAPIARGWLPKPKLRTRVAAWLVGWRA